MTTPPALSPDEPMRLRAVRELGLVDTPLEERFERLTRLAKSMLGMEIAAISLVEADRQFFKSIQGLDVCGTSRDVSFCGHTILGEDLLVIPDAASDARFADNPLVTGPPHIASYAAAPLRSPDGFKVGSLCVIDSSPREFCDADLQNLRDLAAFAELELRSAAANAVQADLMEKVAVERRRALVDPLTRMWNRAGILQLAEDVMGAARDAEGDEDGAGAAVILVDLDRFKQINDGLGHSAGDEVLQSAARRLLSAVRETDAVGRLGGDEFLCVLSACESAEQAERVAERARVRITESPIVTGAGPVTLTATLGVCFMPSGGAAEVKHLIDAADVAMYDAKRAGRNGLCVAPVWSDAA